MCLIGGELLRLLLKLLLCSVGWRVVTFVISVLLGPAQKREQETCCDGTASAYQVFEGLKRKSSIPKHETCVAQCSHRALTHLMMKESGKRPIRETMMSCLSKSCFAC